MRKNYLIFSLLTLIGIMLTSCIKEEAADQRADILAATFENQKEFLLTAPIIENESVVFRLKQNNDNMTFAPKFTLTPGATIVPANGSIHDFSKEAVTYTVTSESGQWEKTYTVSFIRSDFPTYFSMDNYRLANNKDNLPYSPDGVFKYDVYTEFLEYLPGTDGKLNPIWSSGNSGFSIMPASTLKLTNPSGYPTTVTLDGYKKSGVLLQTILTGLDHSMSGFLKMPGIAAGNIFAGSFKLEIFSPAKSPKFGIPYNTKQKPAALKGYYKYKAGDFFGNKNEFALKDLDKDTWDGYAILFEKTEKNNFLAGDHNFKSDKMVMVARVDSNLYSETDTWTAFEAPFKLLEGKTFDSTKEYMIAIVFTSSIQGGDFRGAIGSTLYIDEVELILEDN